MKKKKGLTFAMLCLFRHNLKEWGKINFIVIFRKFSDFFFGFPSEMMVPVKLIQKRHPVRTNSAWPITEN